VAGTGAVLDPSGLAICTASDVQSQPGAAFDGASFLVVWDDWRAFASKRIYGARVATTGQVLDPAGIGICSGGVCEYADTPAVAFNGSHYLVAWYDARTNDADIYASRVDPSGTVLDPDGFPVCTVPYGQNHPAVAPDGDGFLVVWDDLRTRVDLDVWAAPVSALGEVGDEFAVAIDTDNQLEPSVAAGPGNRLLVTYSGLADSVDSLPVNTMRAWGRLLLAPGAGIFADGFESGDTGRWSETVGN
jgi:hypothetical protein